jgi:hypothetical protein
MDSSVLSLQLIRDIGVRWNSTFAMIERALRLEHVLRRYCIQWLPDRGEYYDLVKDFLDASDWEELRHFEELLKPFDKATKRAKGNTTIGSHGAL